MVMRDLAGSGMTLIGVTHEMQFAREMADWVVFIESGEILEEASPAHFFTRPAAGVDGCRFCYYVAGDNGARPGSARLTCSKSSRRGLTPSRQGRAKWL